MKLISRHLFAVVALACAGAVHAEMYVCEKNGQKFFSDTVCGNAAKEISGEHSGMVMVNEVPDGKTMKDLCGLAENYQKKQQKIMDDHASQYRYQSEYDSETRRSDYNAEVMKNSDSVEQRLRISEAFRCAHPQLANDIHYIVTTGYPFSRVAHREDNSDDSSMAYCIRQIGKAITKRSGERPGC